MIQDIHPHTFDNRFEVNCKAQDEDYIFFFKGNELLLYKENDLSVLPRRKQLDGINETGIFLFRLDDTACYLITECSVPNSELFVFHEVHFRNPFAQKELDYCTSVALHLKNWYDQHKFCGKCGTATVPQTEERAITCPACKHTKFPTISPAIIVAVLHEDKILLAHNINFPEGFYSLIAGYTDIGETIENTISRELKEEVGIDIKSIRYYKSQPWPFSGSLMIGFIAESEDNQTIQVDGKEIQHANWYTRDNLPIYPPDRSIAGEIIEKFKKGEL